MMFNLHLYLFCVGLWGFFLMFCLDEAIKKKESKGKTTKWLWFEWMLLAGTMGTFTYFILNGAVVLFTGGVK